MPAAAQPLDAPPGDLGVGIGHADDDPADPGRDQGVGARAGAPGWLHGSRVTTTVAPAGRLRRAGGVEGDDLGVAPAGRFGGAVEDGTSAVTTTAPTQGFGDVRVRTVAALATARAMSGSSSTTAIVPPSGRFCHDRVKNDRPQRGERLARSAAIALHRQVGALGRLVPQLGQLGVLADDAVEGGGGDRASPGSAWRAWASSQATTASGRPRPRRVEGGDDHGGGGDGGRALAGVEVPGPGDVEGVADESEVVGALQVIDPVAGVVVLERPAPPRAHAADSYSGRRLSVAAPFGCGS